MSGKAGRADRAEVWQPHQRVIRLRRVGPEDEAAVDRLLDRLTGYSMRVDGVPKAAGGTRRLLTAVPPGWAMDAKHVFVVMQGSEPVGLVDVIDGYPDPGVAFIGLLAIAEDRHGRGIGRAALRLTEDFARSVLRASRLRLAVVDANPVHGFWRKMGFRETGEVRTYEGEAASANAVLMEKIIRGGGEWRTDAGSSRTSTNGDIG